MTRYRIEIRNRFGESQGYVKAGGAAVDNTIYETSSFDAADGLADEMGNRDTARSLGWHYDVVMVEGS